MVHPIIHVNLCNFCTRRVRRRLGWTSARACLTRAEVKTTRQKKIQYVLSSIAERARYGFQSSDVDQTDIDTPPPSQHQTCTTLSSTCGGRSNDIRSSGSSGSTSSIDVSGRTRNGQSHMDGRTRWKGGGSSLQGPDRSSRLQGAQRTGPTPTPLITIAPRFATKRPTTEVAFTEVTPITSPDDNRPDPAAGHTHNATSEDLPDAAHTSFQGGPLPAVIPPSRLRSPGRGSHLQQTRSHPTRGPISRPPVEDPKGRTRGAACGKREMAGDESAGLSCRQDGGSGWGRRGRGGGSQSGRGLDSSSAAGAAAAAAARVVNSAIVEAGVRKSVPDLLQLVANHGKRFNHVNTATALHRLGSCGLQPGGYEARRLLSDARFLQLECLTGEHALAFSAREVVNCLWALAKLGYQPARVRANVTAPSALLVTTGECGPGAPGAPDDDDRAHLLPGLTRRFEAVVQQQHQQLTSQTVSMVLWALGRLGHHPGVPLLRGLTGRLVEVEVLRTATPQEVSNSLLGLAKLGWSPGAEVMDTLARGSLPKVVDFKPQELCNTLWSLARLGHQDVPLQNQMFIRAATCFHEFKPQNIANLVWAAGSLGLRPGAARDINPAGGGEEGVTRLKGMIPEELLRSCCDLVAGNPQSFSQQELSNLMWAIAKMGYVHEPLMLAAAANAARQLAAEAGVVGDGMSAEEGTSARDTKTQGAVAERIALGAVRSNSQTWSCQSVANTTWAFATLGFQPGNQFLSQVCRHLSSPRYLPSYKWQELSNTVWALAVLGHHDKEVLGVVEKEVAARIRAAAAHTADRDGTGEGADMKRLLVPAHPDLRPQHVSNLMWAFASLQHPAPELFAALLPLLRHRHHLHLFSGQELSNCIWAAARLGKYDQEVMDTVAVHIRHHCLPLLKPQEVAKVAWAYGELRHDHRALFDSLLEALLRFMSSIKSEYIVSAEAEAVASISTAHVKMQELNSTCRTACVFGWRYPALLDVVTQLLQAFALHGRPQRVGSDCGASVVISADPDGGGWEGPKGQQLKVRELCNFIWSMSLVGACSPKVWGQLMELFGRMLATRPGGGSGAGNVLELLADEELAQIYQAYLHVQLDHPSAVLATGPPGLLREGAAALRFLSCWAAQVSTFQQVVSVALTRLGLRHSVELLTSDGAFSIDLAVEMEVEVALQTAARPVLTVSAAVRGGGGCSGSGSLHDRAAQVMRVAVEVDGPWHFTANTRQPLSTTLYRRRCLEARGWTVVSVPYWRWNECGSKFMEQDTLLRELLQEAGLQSVLDAGKRQ